MLMEEVCILDNSYSLEFILFGFSIWLYILYCRLIP
jgi:hypothetical protein